MFGDGEERHIPDVPAGDQLGPAMLEVFGGEQRQRMQVGGDGADAGQLGIVIEQQQLVDGRIPHDIAEFVGIHDVALRGEDREWLECGAIEVPGGGREIWVVHDGNSFDHGGAFPGSGGGRPGPAPLWGRFPGRLIYLHLMPAGA